MSGKQSEAAPAYPVPIVPVYYIHSFEQPFCNNSRCQCQVNRAAAIQLFTQIVEGRLELEQAARLTERTVY